MTSRPQRPLRTAAAAARPLPPPFPTTPFAGEGWAAVLRRPPGHVPLEHATLGRLCSTTCTHLACATPVRPPQLSPPARLLCAVALLAGSLARRTHLMPCPPPKRAPRSASQAPRSRALRVAVTAKAARSRVYTAEGAPATLPEGVTDAYSLKAYAQNQAKGEHWGWPAGCGWLGMAAWVQHRLPRSHPACLLKACPPCCPLPPSIRPHHLPGRAPRGAAVRLAGALPRLLLRRAGPGGEAAGSLARSLC